MGCAEFGMLADNGAEVGLAFSPPSVVRVLVDVGAGQRVSTLRVGRG